MSDLDSQKAPPSFLADDVPASEVERERRYKETLAMLRALESDKHVATVCEPHMSRYTIEWNGQALPVGTRLYARTPQAEAKAGADEPHCQDYPNCPNLSCSACEKAQARAAQRGSAFLLWADANSMNTATAPDGRFFDPMTAVAEKAYRAAEFGAALVQPEANSSEPPKGSFSKVGADEGRQWADDDFYAGHPPPVLHDDPMTNAEILIQVLSDRLDTARRALADAAAMQVVQPTLSQIKANAAWAMTETDPRRLLPRSATYGAQPKPTEGGAVKGAGMAAHALAAEIVRAVAADTHGGGCDIEAGLFGPEMTKLIRQIATEYMAAPAGSGEADYKCRAYACRRVRVEMQAEISRLRAGREAVATGIVGWIHEDQLPDGYPYEAMFRHSKVDGVRMFPVFAPAAAAEALSNAASALVRLVEGPGCLRWEDGSGSRLKDTNEWCAFYCAARRLAGGEGA